MPVEADDFAADDDFFGNDRLVLIIFRLQTDVIFLFVEALDGRIFIANECDYDVAILRVILLGNDEVVAFMDACIDHAVASNDEHEAVVILADEFGRQGIDGLRVFICGDRFACTDGSNERHRDHLLAAPGICHDFDRARRVRILADRALKFQTLQIIVHGGCRAQTDRLSDLADRSGGSRCPRSSDG